MLNIKDFVSSDLQYLPLFAFLLFLSFYKSADFNSMKINMLWFKNLISEF